MYLNNVQHVQFVQHVQRLGTIYDLRLGTQGKMLPMRALTKMKMPPVPFPNTAPKAQLRHSGREFGKRRVPQQGRVAGVGTRHHARLSRASGLSASWRWGSYVRLIK